LIDYRLIHFCYFWFENWLFVDFFQAAALFVHSLVAEAVVVYAKERNGDIPIERQFKILTPLHIVSAIVQNPNFDFLTNHGLEK
jgi:hypothetical protein